MSKQSRLSKFSASSLKHRVDDPYEICCQMAPSSAVERIERQLKEDGFHNSVDGHDHLTLLNEGDSIALEFRGNLCLNSDCDGQRTDALRMIYNSNLPTKTNFRIREVDR